MVSRARAIAAARGRPFSSATNAAVPRAITMGHSVPLPPAAATAPQETRRTADTTLRILVRSKRVQSQMVARTEKIPVTWTPRATGRCSHSKAEETKTRIGDG